MDDLPELPFEKILSRLNLEDRLKSRVVSKGWRKKFDSYPVKCLCYSNRPSDFILGKNRWVSGAFAENFVSSTRPESFFSTFNRSILSNLKHLRLCEVKTTAFTEIFESLDQLERLDIICSGFPDSGRRAKFKLNLPMLQSVHLKEFFGVDRLNVDAPRLKKVTIRECLKQIELVHAESVEVVAIDHLSKIPMKNLTNLKQLYIRSPQRIDSTLLSDLGQLREIHLSRSEHVSKIFEQKQQYRRADLKVYLSGLLLNGPENPTADFVHLAENQSRLVDEIPLHSSLHYSTIERVAPEVAINVVRRFIDLDAIYVDRRVQDVPRFLAFLQTFDNIVELYIQADQPQELFDRLPEHCSVQRLAFRRLPPDTEFLFRFRHLIDLQVLCRVDNEIIRRIFELEFFSSFEFLAGCKFVTMSSGERFCVSVSGSFSTYLLDVNDAIQFIAEDPRLRP